MNARSGWRPLELAEPRSTSTISAGSGEPTRSERIAAGADRSAAGHQTGGFRGSRSDCNLMDPIITAESVSDPPGLFDQQGHCFGGSVRCSGGVVVGEDLGLPRGHGPGQGDQFGNLGVVGDVGQPVVRSGWAGRERTLLGGWGGLVVP